MRRMRVFMLLTRFSAIILSHNMSCSNIYHKADNYIHILNYPGIIWKPVLFPSKWFVCVRQILGREHQDHCHYLTMVTRWCASTTVMLWSCSYETWRTNLAEALFISFRGAVCVLWGTTLYFYSLAWSGSSLCMGVGAAWPPDALRPLLEKDEPCLFKFLCLAEIGFTWDGGSLHQQILWSN